VGAVLADPAESERLGRTARVAALRRNDVAHRWREMAELAGIPVSSGIEARIKQLAGVAETIAAGGAELPPAGPRGFPPFPPRQRDWRDETDPGGSAGGYRDPAFDRF
jgi:hypothetical protein